VFQPPLAAPAPAPSVADDVMRFDVVLTRVVTGGFGRATRIRLATAAVGRLAAAAISGSGRVTPSGAESGRSADAAADWETASTASVTRSGGRIGRAAAAPVEREAWFVEFAGNADAAVPRFGYAQPVSVGGAAAAWSL
jgi:hypothetical protein